MGLIHTLVIGIRLCLMLVTIGIILCATLVGPPIGLTLIALGFTYLALPKRRFL